MHVFIGFVYSMLCVLTSNSKRAGLLDVYMASYKKNVVCKEGFATDVQEVDIKQLPLGDNWAFS